jgi:general secretion pathway protein H
MLPSPAGSVSRARGFTLLELVVALAVIAAIYALVFPGLVPTTGRAKLEALTMNIAGLLKADRNASLRLRREVVTQFDLAHNEVRSGASARTVRLPADISLDLLTSADGFSPESLTGVRFFSDGSSSGGAMVLTRGHAGYEIRVNWFTGAVSFYERGS